MTLPLSRDPVRHGTNVHVWAWLLWTLCRQLIWSKGEFANEYGCPVETLAV
jgi:hypothetical protein